VILLASAELAHRATQAIARLGRLRENITALARDLLICKELHALPRSMGSWKLRRPDLSEGEDTMSKPRMRKSTLQRVTEPMAATAQTVVKRAKRSARAVGRGAGEVMESIGEAIAERAETVRDGGARAIRSISGTGAKKARGKGVKRQSGGARVESKAAAKGPKAKASSSNRGSKSARRRNSATR
jgi:hypothetical protein